MVHKCLKGGRSIAKAKEHDYRFAKTKWSDKCGFPLVFFLNMDIVVPPSDIELGKKGRILHVINQLRDEGKRVSIVNGMAVQVAVVLAGSKGSVFFGNKEEQGSPRGFRRNNSSHFQVFINKCLASISFGRIEGVNFGDFGDEGVFEVNSMVEGSMRGRGVIGFF